MNRNYKSADEMGLTAGSSIAEWAATRETSLPIAVAIRAISDSRRTPEAIWEAPNDAEVDHVKMAVEEYIRLGDFPAEPEYCWGEERLTL